jgi:quinol monooxygenase YgiN
MKAKLLNSIQLFKKAKDCQGCLFLIFGIVWLMLFFNEKSMAQEKKQLVRLAKLVIDSTQLNEYQTLLKEEIEASVRLEPGVLTLYAVAENANPSHITILEIYASIDAYKAHLQTPHFIKYKMATQNMVKSLELVETTPLIPEMKIK